MTLAQDLHRDWSALDVKRAVISATVDPNLDTNLVAAVAGKRLALLQMVLIPSASVTVRLRSSVTNLTGPLPTNSTVPLQLGRADVPWLLTAAGEALNLLNGASTITFGGFLVYVERD